MPIFKKHTKKEPWQIAAARYCVANGESGLVQDDLIKYIRSLYEVNENQARQFWEEEITHPSGRQHSRSWSKVNEKNIWTPPLELVSKITDYDELQEARTSSRRAMWVAIGSFAMAIIVGLLQVAVQIWTSMCLK